ncbi:MAG: NAD-dependent epimerase/dehydratase family protein [Planctomycetota bacterium]|nr:NAD-dependent epimerase/dehydratase family protein [Planctomycetaceae bacterium]MDQ3331860.1 NAD-dependent epimerase/dehydratase family protein [Planctomycetota bacterium]
MRVLVTGGAGFIGSHIVDQLVEAGHQPFVVDDLSSGDKANVRPEAPIHKVDIRDTDGLKRAFDEIKPEAVCHQAAQLSVSRSVREPVFDAQVNVLGLLGVFENAVRVGAKRIVFASSGGVLYGDVQAPAREDHPAAPISPYGVTKLAGEGYLRFMAREFGISGVALRYSNVYGPRQSPHGEAGVVAIFCKKMLAGEAATINGDGRYIRDYVFGPDVARANVAAITGEFPEPFSAFNIGTGRPTDVNQLADKIRTLVIDRLRKTGRTAEVPAPVHGPARAGDLRSNLVDASAAQTAMGWKPTADVSEGLARTVAWFDEQGR